MVITKMVNMDHLKKYLPQNSSDQMAFGMMLFLIHMIVLFEAFVILPDIFMNPLKKFFLIKQSNKLEAIGLNDKVISFFFKRSNIQ